MLQLQHLLKQYDTQKAVDDVSLSVPKGCIFGLLGPNGAGKSSLLRMVTGITQPDSGTIIFNGEPFDALRHSRMIGYMPEERGMYKKMKAGEQALYLARLKGMSQEEASKSIKYWFQKLDMQTWHSKKVEDLSKGMSQKLQFVITILHNPKLLILDEPFSGLDPVNSDIIKDEIFNLAQQGTTIIFSTHRMEQVEEICKEIALINKGKIVLEGQVDSIQQRYKQHQYRLVVEGNLKGFEDQILTYEQGVYSLNLQNTQQANELLKACIEQQLPILEFKEILPSLHDIFIRQVENDAVRQFETN
ncbi:MAG TPA: ATP-binding cassette domain-containing protein [Chitinophagaceae bacterium]|nr:ATP-binding cassette domain-containing protein [Chitinophagaceae bacterium]